MASSGAFRQGPALPAVDERLVAPESRYEILDGRLVHVSPAHPPHGTRHLQIGALLEAHTGADFEVACDMLTRTSETSDVAPDLSVYPDAPDPETGGRQIEQLAFEVVSTESLGHAGSKAASLVARGVRRVFAIDIERSRFLEWSRELGTWRVLDPRGQLEDPALAVPLPIDAMVRSAKADDAVAHALLAKHNHVLEARSAHDRAAGRAEILQQLGEALLALLAARGLSLQDPERVRILDERAPDQFARWLTRAATCTSVAELLAADQREPR